LAKKTLQKTAAATPSFEAGLKRLEQIVHELEEGETTLSDALARYEEGVGLARQSYDLLEKAERKIAVLSGVDADGNAITQPFDQQPKESKPSKARRRSPTRTASPDDSSDPQADESAMDTPGGLF
jgi:exodeoxyribonuclease VII small subunit